MLASMATSYAQFLAIGLLERGTSPILPAISRKSIRSGDRIGQTAYEIIVARNEASERKKKKLITRPWSIVRFAEKSRLTRKSDSLLADNRWLWLSLTLNYELLWIAGTERGRRSAERRPMNMHRSSWRGEYNGYSWLTTDC